MATTNLTRKYRLDVLIKGWAQYNECIALIAELLDTVERDHPALTPNATTDQMALYRACENARTLLQANGWTHDSEDGWSKS